MLKLAGALCVLIMIIVSLLGTVTAGASTVTTVPIKVAVLMDGTDSNTNLTSALYFNVQRVLTWNKIPFEILDISNGQHPALVDSSNNLEYAAAFILATGPGIDMTNSQNILAAINLGMGAVAVLPAASNALLQPAFGIETFGSQTIGSYAFRVLKDKFTFSYAGSLVPQPSFYLNHSLLPEADVIATFLTDDTPAIWDYSYGAGKTVYHNTTATNTMAYWGYLLQSIMYVMPMGVSSPPNVMAIQVDDCPQVYYTPNYLQSYYYDFMTNFLAWLEHYHVHSTFFTAFSFSGNISDFWLFPEPLRTAAAILDSGNELGLHCGSSHWPLYPEYWGGTAAIETEIALTNQHIDILKQRLLQEYNINPNDMISYACPMNAISDEGYRILNDNTIIKYVGQLFDPGPPTGGGVTAMAQSQSATAFPDILKDYLMSSGNSLKSALQEGLTAYSEMASPDDNVPPIYRDFGWEDGLHLYNVPRAHGGFIIFNNPQDLGYNTVWNILRTLLESGQPYILFTHPDEADLQTDPDITPEDVFNAYSVWAGYIAENYPHYRWMTTTRMGDCLSSRTGVLDARWNPADNSLLLTKAQPDDTVHIKSSKYLQNISVSGDTMTLSFTATPTDYQSSQFDVVRVASDYFIYPRGQKSLMPVLPDQPFVFQPVSPDNRYTLATHVAGLGSVNVSPQQENYDLWTPVRISAVPADGWTFSGWSGDLTGTSNPVTVLIDSNMDITASFAGSGYVLNVSTAGSGTVTKNPDKPIYDYGDTVTLTAIPAQDWNFGGWSGGLSGPANPADITITRNINITATFTQSGQSTVITRPVAAGGDDGFSGPWGYYKSLTWYEAGNPGQPYSAWFRFTGITIPASATITEAHLELNQAMWNSGTKLKIKAEKAAGPNAPTGNVDLNGRTRTTAGADWTSGYSDYAYHNTPDFAPVIQELVNSFSYDNGVMQILVDNNAGSGEAAGLTLESGFPARLYIKYQTGTPVNRAPVLDPIGNKTANAGSLLQFAVSAADPDGNPLTYLATNLPPGASFNSTTHTFSWTPDTIGTYPGVYFEVSDGLLNDSEEITITVLGNGPGSGEITREIAANADDGFSGSWGFYPGLVWYEVGNPGQPYNAWFRFTGVTIPAGATITEAHLELNQAMWNSGTKLKIKAEKAASPNAPTGNVDLNGRTRTTAGADWTSGYSDYTYHNTPDFAPVIQELVNSFSYDNGVIQILIDNNAGNGEAAGLTRESGSPARLYIKYQAGTPVNHAPVLNPIGNKAVGAGGLLQFSISATDADGDSLTYLAANLPDGASFNATTRTFTWTPDTIGTYPGVYFEVSDGLLNDFEEITITVNNLNNPPVLNPIGNKTVNKASILQFTVSATDPDGNPLTYSASNLPPGASFNTTTHSFSWTPDTAGTYPGVYFEVSDGQSTDSEEITITVTDGQPPPQPGELTREIAGGADDGFASSWEYVADGAWYEIGNPGVPYSAWFRFTDITIPAGATILEAHLELVQASFPSGTHLKISAEKSASPGAPTSYQDLFGRTRTSAGADWDSGFSDWARHNTPDFASVIQELVNTFSYANGVIMILIDNDDGNAEATGECSESGLIPRLYIKWQ